MIKDYSLLSQYFNIEGSMGRMLHTIIAHMAPGCVIMMPLSEKLPYLANLTYLSNPDTKHTLPLSPPIPQGKAKLKTCLVPITRLHPKEI